jgi:hypothetical protein
VPTRTFRIVGSVSDVQTQKPVPNLLVQATDTSETQSVLGSGTTDGQGRFQIVAEAEVPTDGIIPANLRVFQGTQPLAVTGDTSIPNLFGFDRTAVLQVQMAQVDQPLKDHVTVNQVFTTMNFVQQSDFVGTFREGRDRTTAVGSVLMDSLKTALKSVKMPAPLQPSTIRNRDVINQDPTTAQTRLAAQKVTVTGTQPYQPGTTGLTSVTSISSSIQPGDQVELYTENNVVKAYKITRSGSTTAALLGMGGQQPSIIKDTVNLTNNVNTLQANVRDLQARTQEIEQVKAAQESNTATLAALQQKAAAFDQLQAQLAKVQAESAQKDQVITKLQGDVGALQENQKSLSQITPERIAALEANLSRLQPK